MVSISENPCCAYSGVARCCRKSDGENASGLPPLVVCGLSELWEERRAADAATLFLRTGRIHGGRVFAVVFVSGASRGASRGICVTG
jgi:hypothetical protein